MKKLFALVIGLCAFSGIYALPVYNFDQPHLLKFGAFSTNGGARWAAEFGFRGDYVFDRKLKIKPNANNLVAFNKDVCEFKTSISALNMTINYRDSFEVFGWVGLGIFELETQVDYLTVSTTGVIGHTGFENIQGSSRSGAAWGWGLRAILWQCGCTAVGFDAEYAHLRGEFRCLTFNGAPIQKKTAPGVFHPVLGVPFSAERFNVHSDEYQFALGISHRIRCLVPYVAVKTSYVAAKFNGPTYEITPAGLFEEHTIVNPRLKLRSRIYVGLAVGVSLIDMGRMHVTAEGRFIDETAMTIAADFRF